jgi:hypothetical protein
LDEESCIRRKLSSTTEDIAANGKYFGREKVGKNSGHSALG